MTGVSRGEKLAKIILEDFVVKDRHQLYKAEGLFERWRGLPWETGGYFIPSSVDLAAITKSPTRKNIYPGDICQIDDSKGIPLSAGHRLAWRCLTRRSILTSNTRTSDELLVIRLSDLFTLCSIDKFTISLKDEDD